MRLNTEKQAIERGMMGRAKGQSVSPIVATIALAPNKATFRTHQARGVNSEQVFLE
jgi:hypothetical protein